MIKRKRITVLSVNTFSDSNNRTTHVVLGQYFPAGQLVHVVSLSREYVPLAQGVLAVGSVLSGHW